MDILDYKEPITKIYFVRHGQTKANKLHLIFGHLDWDLTKEGIQQAKKAASKLYRLKKGRRGEGGTGGGSQIDFIISSPLKRARHTARIIAKSLKIKNIINDKNLMEKSEGLWEGKNYWQVRDKDPKNYFNWIKNPYRNKPPKGESVEDLSKRVKKFYSTIIKKYLGKNIIVVAHSGPIRLFILNLLKANIDKYWYLKIECGSITEVHVSKKHSMVWGLNKN